MPAQPDDGAVLAAAVLLVSMTSDAGGVGMVRAPPKLWKSVTFRSFPSSQTYRTG